MAMPQCCYLAKGAKRPSNTTKMIKFDRIPFDPCNSIKRLDLCPFDQKNLTYLQPPVIWLYTKTKVELPQTFFVSDQSQDGLCNFVFENLDQNSSEHDWLANRARIASTNDAVDEVNEFMSRRFPGDAKVYKSCDSVEESAHR